MKKRPVTAPTSEKLYLMKLLRARSTSFCAISYHAISYQMKKRMAWLLTLCLLIALAVPALAGSYAVVHNPNPEDRLNLRAAARKDAVSLGKYYSGVKVTLLSGEKDGWYHVSIGALEGYMDADFLVCGEKADHVKSAMPTVMVTGQNGLTLTSRPNSGTAQRHYDPGRTALVYGVGIDYLHVRMDDGTEGFIPVSLVTPNLSFSSSGKSNPSYAADTVVVVNPDPTDRLNLRTQPSGDAPILMKFYSGVMAEPQGDADDGWLHVRIGALSGYMKSDYLHGGDAAYAQSVSAIPSVRLVNRAHLYSAMSESHGIEAVLDTGEFLQVIGVGTDYLYVRDAMGRLGFVRSGLVSPYIPFDLGR